MKIRTVVFLAAFLPLTQGLIIQMLPRDEQAYTLKFEALTCTVAGEQDSMRSLSAKLQCWWISTRRDPRISGNSPSPSHRCLTGIKEVLWEVSTLGDVDSQYTDTVDTVVLGNLDKHKGGLLLMQEKELCGAPNYQGV